MNIFQLTGFSLHFVRDTHNAAFLQIYFLLCEDGRVLNSGFALSSRSNIPFPYLIMILLINIAIFQAKKNLYRCAPLSIYLIHGLIIVSVARDGQRFCGWTATVTGREKIRIARTEPQRLRLGLCGCGSTAEPLPISNCGVSPSTPKNNGGPHRNFSAKNLVKVFKKF